MQIVCISRGTLTGGKVLAERLAANLGYPCLSREDLIEAAIHEGIHVGKIETAMVKGRGFSDQLSLEREHYLAFTRAYLCDQALKGRLVYHGRTGHLLLPGVKHILRVRVVADLEYRIRSVMQSLGLDREKAHRYVLDVDEDRRRWAHALYGVSCDDVAQYDFVVNLQQLNVENASAALTTVAQLPDFQLPPASRKAVEDLRLAARARVLLARGEHTYGGSFKVAATDGVVTVTYLPQDARLADEIPAALAGLEAYRELRTTMATSNLLWIQEAYDPASEAFRNVVAIATKWGAAVELLRFVAEEKKGDAVGVGLPGTTGAVVQPARPLSGEYNGGIEDDVEGEGEEAGDDGGLKDTVEELAKQGRSAGGREVRGEQTQILESLGWEMPYTMAIVGNVFLSKGSAAQVRMARELRGFLADNIKTPVVATEELKRQFLFGKRDLFRLVGYLAVVVVIYLLVFTNQKQILTFLTGDGWVAKVMAAVAVFLFVPIVAFAYGTVSRTFLKLIKIE